MLQLLVIDTFTALLCCRYIQLLQNGRCLPRQDIFIAFLLPQEIVILFASFGPLLETCCLNVGSVVPEPVSLRFRLVYCITYVMETRGIYLYDACLFQICLRLHQDTSLPIMNI